MELGIQKEVNGQEEVGIDLSPYFPNFHGPYTFKHYKQLKYLD